MKRFEQLAADIAHSIQSGLLHAGDRLPSIRLASARRRVSPSTVFQAYYLLEARGLIQARARSGYFVAPHVRRLPPETHQVSDPPTEPCLLDTSSLVYRILKSTQDREVVPLGSAFLPPLLFPLQRLGKAMGAAASQLDPWSTLDDLTPGNRGLRRQVALRYLIDGLHVDADHVLVTNGAFEALHLCLSVVCKPGDAVIVECPCFYGCLQALERFGLRAIEVRTDARDGIDLAALEAAIVEHRPKACWVMSNFQNPLGSSMPTDKKRALVQMAARHALPVIEDDVYAELYHGSARPVPLKAFDTDDWVLHCGSFSKTLAPGYQIGWVASARFAQLLAMHKLEATLTTCIPAQVAIATYLAAGGYDRGLRRIRTALALNRDHYLESIGAYFPKGTCVSRPGGGYFLWVELPAPVNTLHIHHAAMQAGISIAPGPMFSARQEFKHCMRINFGNAMTPRVEQALAWLGHACTTA